MIPSFRMGLYASASHKLKDPYFANVVFLFNGDAIADTSSYAHGFVSHVTPTIIPISGAGSDTDFPHGALKVNHQSLEVTTFGTEFDFGAGDFTFEFDYKTLGTGGTDPIVVGTYSTFSANGGVGFFDNPSFGVGKMSLAANGVTNFCDFTATAGVLQQVCYSRVGTNLYVFQNGTLVQTVTGYTAHLTTPATLRIGQNLTNGNSNDFNGLIGRIRITKGVGRHTTSYTTSRNLYPTS